MQDGGREGVNSLIQNGQERIRTDKTTVEPRPKLDETDRLRPPLTGRGQSEGGATPDLEPLGVGRPLPAAAPGRPGARKSVEGGESRGRAGAAGIPEVRGWL